MSFFKSIEQHLEGMNLSVVISKNDNGLTVSVLPQPTCKDEAMKNLTPILLKGTADELDAQFAGIIQQPLQKVSGITANVVEFEKAAEIQAEKTAMAKAETDKKKKAKENAEKEITKAETLIKEKKHDEAIKHLNKAIELYPGSKKAKTLLADCKKATGDTGLFETTAEEPKVIPVEEVKPTVSGDNIDAEAEPKQDEVVNTTEEIVNPELPKTVSEVEHLQENPKTVAESFKPEEKPSLKMDKAIELYGDLLTEQEYSDLKKNILNQSGIDKLKEAHLKAEQLKAQVPEEIKEVVNESSNVEVVTLPPNSLQQVNPNTGENIGKPIILEKPKRMDYEPQDAFDARVKAWEEQQPKANNPAATNPATTPVEEEKSPMQEMAEEEMAARENYKAKEQAFEAENPVTPPSASNNIEILG